MNTREKLELAQAGRVQPDQLYEFFATQVPQLVVLYQKSAEAKQPLVAKGDKPNSKFVVAFTDREAAYQVEVNRPEQLEMREEAALPFLINAYRSDTDGILLNPGLPSRLFLVKKHLLLLLREYIVQAFSQLPGAWVPMQEGHPLLAEYQPDSYTLSVYLNEATANYIAKQSDGVAAQQSWETIFQQCWQLGAKVLYMHAGLPEQNLLTAQQLEKIHRGPRQGYVEAPTTIHPFVNEREHITTVEKPTPTVKHSATVANEDLKRVEEMILAGTDEGWEVCEALAEVKQIWIVVDTSGNLVILAGQDESPIVDFFTSEAKAQHLIGETRRQNLTLPNMTPRLVPAKKVYEVLAPRQPIVWVNRGSADAWTDTMGDTLPYILQLMEQMGIE